MSNNIHYSTNLETNVLETNVLETNVLEGDQLNQLPFDKTIPTHNELMIVDSLFKEQKGVFDKILSNTKDLLILAMLFVILSLPQIDSLIKSFISVTNNSFYILIAVKAFLFILSYFIINNIYLVRK